MFVGVEPFASREVLQLRMVATGEGSMARQISYTLVFIVIVTLAFSFRGIDAIKAFPISLAMVLLWCVVSATWAIEPDISFRRAMLTVIVVSSVVLAVDMIGVQRALHLMRFVLAGILLINFISIPLVPQAVHLPGEFDQGLVGNWRGLYYHKNTAGPVAALSAILFFHYALARRRQLDWLLFTAAVIFVVGARSKTAIVLLPTSLLVSILYRRMCRTEFGCRLFVVGFAMVMVLATVVSFAAYETIGDILADRNLFTGRGAIWQTVIAYVEQHPILGSGFSSFWQIGSASPILKIASDRWMDTVANSHNGFLEILLTTGIIGLFLAVLSFVILPLKSLLMVDPDKIEIKSLLLSMFAFIVLSNLIEAIFLYRDLPQWTFFVFVLSILHQLSPTRGGLGKAQSFVTRQRRRRNESSFRSLI